MAEPPESGGDLHKLLLEFGRALSMAGAAVSETQERLSAVAVAAGAKDAHIVVLPTAVLISLGRGGWTTMEAIPQLGGMLRLDQIAAVYEVVDDAQRGATTPAQGLARMREIRAMKPRFGPLVMVLAYTVMTGALCLILQPAPRDVLVSMGLGLIVGVILRFTEHRPAFAVLTPVVCAMVVSALSFLAATHGAADPGLRTLIAPLVLLLPGSVVTTATQELASGEMVAGSSRLVYGSVQMFLLAFGIIVGAELAGVPRASIHDSTEEVLGWWAPWLGVLIFGLAVAVYCSAPRSSLKLLLLVLLSAWIGQLAGERLAGTEVSGFFGALVMTPVALAVSRLPGAPPAQVAFLPAFWLLVPGAVGLIGVTEAVGDPAAASLEDLIAPLGSIVSIALGVLCGASLFRGLAAIPDGVRDRLARETPGSP